MIHKNYRKLNDRERAFVDEAFSRPLFAKALNDYGVKLDTSDGVERAIEAVATWVIESRDPAKSYPDFTLCGNAGDTVFLLRPNTEEADAELRENVSDEAQWLGKALAVEHRYINGVVEQLRANDFTVEV